MIVILKPVGRGNWQPVELRISGKRNAPLPLELARGDRVTIAGRLFRVSRVFA